MSDDAGRRGDRPDAILFAEQQRQGPRDTPQQGNYVSIPIVTHPWHHPRADLNIAVTAPGRTERPGRVIRKSGRSHYLKHRKL